MSPPLRHVRLGTVPYRDAWALQQALAEARRDGHVADDVLLTLEHPPVYTMGRNGDPAHVPGGPAALRALGAEYVEADRGGSVTFHGPGQVVAYPLVRLAGVFPVPGAPQTGDVLRYLRALEEALCATCAECGVAARRRPPYTGAWVETDKIAAIGVKLAGGGVTTHGVALNVTTDLRWFASIVPCGIADGGVTSLAREGSHVAPSTVVSRLAAHLAAALGRSPADPDETVREIVDRWAAAARNATFVSDRTVFAEQGA